MSIENFNVTVTGQEPVVDAAGLVLTSGSKGVYTATYAVDDAWSDLTLEAVFVAAPVAWPTNPTTRDLVRRSVPLENNAATVDSDVLAKPGLRLWVGLQGLDEEGTIVKNSTLALVDKIQHGADPDGPGDGDVPQTRYQALLGLVMSGGATDEQIATAVEKYLERNPIDGSGNDGVGIKNITIEEV